MKCVIVSLLIACTSLCAQDESALRQRIQQLERRGEWERAVAGYETLTRLRPEDGGVARGFARALSASGQHERVVAHLDQWLQKHVDDYMAYLLLGDAHQQIGRSDKAVKTWRRLLKIRPNEAALYQQVSDRCQAAGQTNAAIAVLVEGRAALGDAQLFSWELASLHLNAGLYTRAVDLLFQSIAQRPNRLPVVEHQLGPACQNDGGALLQALSEHAWGDDPVPKARLMSTCALFAGQAERGLEELIGQVSHPEVVELLYQYASQSEARGFRDVAISAYGEYAGSSENASQVFRALLKRAQLSARGADSAQALAHYADLAARFPGRPEALEALVGIARLQLAAEEDPEAIVAGLLPVVDAPVRGAWTLEALELMAESTLRAGDVDASAQWIERLSAQGQAAGYAAAVRRAELAYFNGDCASVIDGLSVLTSEEVDHPLANDALDFLLVCEEFKSEAMLPELVRAELLERQGESVRAAKHWQRVVREATPRLRDWALLQRAQSIEGKDPSSALGLYEQLLSESTDGRYEVEAQLARAHLLWRVGRPDEALRVCEAALLASPADARAPELRVRIRRLREELDRGSLP